MKASDKFRNICRRNMATKNTATAAMELGVSRRSYSDFINGYSKSPTIVRALTKRYKLDDLYRQYLSEKAHDQAAIGLLKRKSAIRSMPPSQFVQMAHPEPETHPLMDFSVLPEKWQRWCGYLERAV